MQANKKVMNSIDEWDKIKSNLYARKGASNEMTN
jgi:hypothetical protein